MTLHIGTCNVRSLSWNQRIGELECKLENINRALIDLFEVRRRDEGDLNNSLERTGSLYTSDTKQI